MPSNNLTQMIQLKRTLTKSKTRKCGTMLFQIWQESLQEFGKKVCWSLTVKRICAIGSVDESIEDNFIGVTKHRRDRVLHGCGQAKKKQWEGF